MISLQRQIQALRRRLEQLEGAARSIRSQLELLEAAALQVPALPAGRDYGDGVRHLRTCACERCCSTRIEHRRVG